MLSLEFYHVALLVILWLALYALFGYYSSVIDPLIQQADPSSVKGLYLYAKNVV